MKCRSESFNFSSQSAWSDCKSISSDVQKEATWALYIRQRSGCSIGKREKREPLSSLLHTGSMKPSIDTCEGAFFDIVEPPREKEVVDDCGAIEFLSDPPRHDKISLKPFRLLSSCLGGEIVVRAWCLGNSRREQDDGNSRRHPTTR